MVKNLSLFFCICCMLSTYVHSAPKYQGRWGVRIATGASFYTALNSKGYGLALPQELSASYSVTNALQFTSGFRGTFSIPFRNKVPYSMPYAFLIGFRYFYNIKEPIKAYSTTGLYIGVGQAGFELVPSAFGLQWDVSNNISLFIDWGIGVLLGTNPEKIALWEANARIGLNLGLNYHF